MFYLIALKYLALELWLQQVIPQLQPVKLYENAQIPTSQCDRLLNYNAAFVCFFCVFFFKIFSIYGVTSNQHDAQGIRYKHFLHLNELRCIYDYLFYIQMFTC